MGKSKKKIPNNAAGQKPLMSGKAGTRLLWDSYYRGTYVKAQHGELK